MKEYANKIGLPDAMPFFPALFDECCTGMSMAEVGLFITLFVKLYGHKPDDEFFQKVLFALKPPKKVIFALYWFFNGTAERLDKALKENKDIL